MSTIPTLYKSTVDLLQINSTINDLKADFKKIESSVFEIDKRLVRIETFFEVMKMQKKSLYLE